MSAPVSTQPNAPLFGNRLANPTKVYFAGPIVKTCYRHVLVPGLREAFSADENDRARALSDTTTQLPTITPGVVCTGPWFCSCDHGCMHGPGTHGTLGSCDDSGIEIDAARSLVFEANLERIRASTAVFAYIDRSEAYGTCFELGVAMTLNKPIFIGFPCESRLFDDMWFPRQPAFEYIGSVKGAWAKFCRTLPNLGASLNGAASEGSQT